MPPNMFLWCTASVVDVSISPKTKVLWRTPPRCLCVYRLAFSWAEDNAFVSTRSGMADERSFVGTISSLAYSTSSTLPCPLASLFHDIKAAGLSFESRGQFPNSVCDKPVVVLCLEVVFCWCRPRYKGCFAPASRRVCDKAVINVGVTGCAQHVIDNSVIWPKVTSDADVAVLCVWGQLINYAWVKDWGMSNP